MTSARVVTTAVVAPLGTVAVVANSFGITVESLCYMPTYGMQHAASTLVGQSVGARRRAENMIFPPYQTTCFFIPLVAPCTPLLWLADNTDGNGSAVPKWYYHVRLCTMDDGISHTGSSSYPPWHRGAAD